MVFDDYNLFLLTRYRKRNDEKYYNTICVNELIKQPIYALEKSNIDIFCCHVRFYILLVLNYRINLKIFDIIDSLV